MKRFKLFTLIFLTTCVGFSWSDEVKFSINPVPIAFNSVFNFQVEKSLLNGSLGLGFYMAQSGGASREIKGFTQSGAEESILLKYYANGISKNSPWVGEKTSVTSGTLSFDDGDRTETSTNIGTLGLSGQAGYQLCFGSFFIDPFVGAGIAITNDLFGNSDYNSGYISPANASSQYWFSGLSLGTYDHGRSSDSHLLIQYGINFGFFF